MPRPHLLHRFWPATIPARRLFVVCPFPPASLGLEDSKACWQRPATQHRRRHRPPRPSTDSTPPARVAALGETRGVFVERRVLSRLRTAAHAPLGHARVPFDSFLPPRYHTHSANDRTFFTGDWYEHSRPVVYWPLPAASTTTNLAVDGPVVRHLDASARRTRHCRPRRFLRPHPGDALR